MSENQAPKSGANNQIVSFSFESHNIRVVERDGGEAWFVASDVTKALGYENSSDAIHQHCRKATKISYSVLRYADLQEFTAPAKDELNIIPESDVFRLIMRSNLPKAEEFQDWVCEDVLPAIRRTGKYEALPALSPSSSPDNALALVQMAAGGYENLDKKIEAYRAEWKADQSKQTSHIFSQNFQTDDAIDRLEMQLSNLNIRIVKAENLLRRLQSLFEVEK